METSSAAAAPSRPSGIRKAKPMTEGEPGDVNENEGETWYWDEDASDWVNYTPVGTTRNINGYEEQWDGSAWVRVGLPDAGLPLGDAPWHWMLLLALGYGIVRTVKIRKQKLN